MQIKVIKKPFLLMTMLLLSLLLGIIMVLSSNNYNAYAEGEEVLFLEKKIRSTATIEENFDDGSILVVIDKSISGINKKIDNNIFRDVAFSRVIDLTHFNGDIEKNELINKESFHQILKIELSKPAKENVLKAIRALEGQNGILSVSPNYYYKAQGLQPNCASGLLYSRLWGLNGLHGINAEAAWGITTGNNQVKVGVIDSGIINHSDLSANLAAGWDFVNNNSTTNDDVDGHGTLMAGIIGATGVNPNGMVGVCWNVQLVPLQVVNSSNVYVTDAVVSAISWAQEHGIQILNYSVGGYAESIPIANAIGNYNGLFVCAAGNDNNNNDVTPHYPSNFSWTKDFKDRVIAVGAMNEDGTKASYSNYGYRTVSIFAPGDGIITTGSNYGYVTCGGTSAATAFVAGTAALMMSLYENVPDTMTLKEKAIEIKKVILETASKDLPNPLYDMCSCDGYLNADYALVELGYKKRIFNNFGYDGSTFYWTGKVDMTVPHAYSSSMSGNTLLINDYEVIKFKLSTESCFNLLAKINGTVKFQLKDSSGTVHQIENNNIFTSTVSVSIIGSTTIDNAEFNIDVTNLPEDTYTLTLTSTMTRNGWTHNNTKTFSFIVTKPPLCVAEGTLITLADGTQVAVENLTGNENLLVWNMLTGQYDSAPILFIDSDPSMAYEVIELTFSDGTEVKVIDEHAFFDMTLGEYVFLRSDAAQYIGHYFNKQGPNGTWVTVQLTDVDVYTEVTTAWSPVTYGHLCYYVNGMLSMPGATEGFINIFEVDTALMKYDEDAMEEDILTYGLFTYEEFNAIIPIPELVFDAFCGQYLKVSIGKGLITLADIATLLDRYSGFFN